MGPADLGVIGSAARVIVLALLIGASGCSSPGSDAGSSSLAGKSASELVVGSWTLTTLNGSSKVLEQGTHDRTQRAWPSMSIEPDLRAAGSAGVNRWTSRLKPDGLNDGRFELAPVASTMMAGPPQSMRLESEFLGALAAARSIDLELLRDRQLSLFDAKGREVARFEQGRD